MKNAQLHRFGEHVALSLPGKGETVYLTAKDAAKLARALNACSRDVKSVRFSASEFASVQIELSNDGDRFK